MGECPPRFDSSFEENEEYYWQSADEEDQETDLAEESMAQGDDPESQSPYNGDEEMMELIMDNMPLDAALGYLESLKGTLDLVESEADRQKLRDFMFTYNSPLKEALYSGEADCASFLLDAFDIHPQQRFPVKEMLALNIAAEQGHNAVVQVLLDRGADINAGMKEDRRTPLFEACCHDHISTVKYLLERGADPNICDASKVSCPDIAAKKGNEQMVQILLDWGANH